MESVSALTLRTTAPVVAAQAVDTTAPSFGGATATAQTAVQDAPLPPRRRARDTAEAPGFPAGPHVAQLLAQDVFSPAMALPAAALDSYHAAITRNDAESGRLLSLQA